MAAANNPTDDKYLARAKRLIEREAEVCFDVASEHGQMFGNVKHMSWFVQAVADEIRPDPKADEAEAPAPRM